MGRVGGVVGDGQPLAPRVSSTTGWAAFGPLDTGRAALDRTAKRRVIGVVVAWTGTLADGKPEFGSDFCDGWTSFGDFFGGYGFSSAVDATWSFFEEVGCGSDLHLYCIEQ